MTKTGHTAISVGYKKNYNKESLHFAMSNVTFILEFSGLNPQPRQDWSAVVCSPHFFQANTDTCINFN